MGGVLNQLAAAMATLGLAVMLTGMVRLVAARFDLFDYPGGRKAHTRPTPHLGGVAVATVTFGAAGTGALFGIAELVDGMGPLLGASAGVSLLGLVDDLRPLGIRTRLVVETVAAVAVVNAAGLSAGAGVLAVIWIVFITNAFNLFDNSDGAMGTVAVVTSLGLVGCAMADNRPGFALLHTVLAAALIGFLLHNWHPAKIFLGDCGSLFTGFLIASSAVTSHAGAPAAQGFAELFALTAVVSMDTLLVLFSRRRAKRPLMRGGTDHVAHRLRILGLSPQSAAATMGCTALACAGIALLIHDGRLSPISVVPLALAALAAMALLHRVEVYGPSKQRKKSDVKTLTLAPTLTDLAGERR